MPAGSPFTRLCQRLNQPPGVGRADLHLHTTFSDGTYTPEQVVDLARRSGLAAIAITDHDTLHGYYPAKKVAHSLELIPGVEITCEFLGRELHLLAYFVDPEDEALNEALLHVRVSRQRRFHTMVERLAQRGVQVDEVEAPPENGALGRRHLAELLVKAGHADTVSHAFRRYLGDSGSVQVAKERIEVSRAIELVHNAGGVAVWAHPPYDDAKTRLKDLRLLGLDGLEVYFPSCRPGRVPELRHMAHELNMLVTGGSDCHGPEPLRRAVGSFGVGSDDLQRIRVRAGNLARRT